MCLCLWLPCSLHLVSVSKIVCERKDTVKPVSQLYNYKWTEYFDNITSCFMFYLQSVIINEAGAHHLLDLVTVYVEAAVVISPYLHTVHPCIRSWSDHKLRIILGGCEVVVSFGQQGSVNKLTQPRNQTFCAANTEQWCMWSLPMHEQLCSIAALTEASFSFCRDISKPSCIFCSFSPPKQWYVPLRGPLFNLLTVSLPDLSLNPPPLSLSAHLWH